MTQDQLEEIARSWYNEQRGRVVGNTRAWGDLADWEKAQLINSVSKTLLVIYSTSAVRSKP